MCSATTQNHLIVFSWVGFGSADAIFELLLRTWWCSGVYVPSVVRNNCQTTWELLHSVQRTYARNNIFSAKREREKNIPEREFSCDERKMMIDWTFFSHWNWSEKKERKRKRNQINYYLGGSMQMEYVLWVRVWAWLQASQSVNIKQRLIIHRKMRNVILPSDPILPSSPPTIPSESLFA